MSNLYQVKISLKGIKPGIWRRLVVESHILLPDLHKIIQTSMGWTNSHLHQFFINGEFYTTEDMDELYFEDSEYIDYQDIRLSSVLKYEKDSIIYEYDFGDGWVIDITLERRLSEDPTHPLPYCQDGRMNSPPEDVGGVPGFNTMLEALKKHPHDEEYQAYFEWLGQEFDPKFFNREIINELLQRDNYGCIEIY
jgi:hypothetical protein